MDFNIPWTLNADGTIQELGTRVSPHHLTKVVSSNPENAKFRKALWEAHLRTQDKKKQIEDRRQKESAQSSSDQQQRQRVPCGSCGKKRELGALPKVESK